MSIVLILIKAILLGIGAFILRNIMIGLYAYESRDPRQLKKYGTEIIRIGNSVLYVLVLLCFFIAGAIR